MDVNSLRRLKRDFIKGGLIPTGSTSNRTLRPVEGRSPETSLPEAEAMAETETSRLKCGTGDKTTEETKETENTETSC